MSTAPPASSERLDESDTAALRVRAHEVDGARDVPITTRISDYARGLCAEAEPVGRIYEQTCRCAASALVARDLLEPTHGPRGAAAFVNVSTSWFAICRSLRTGGLLRRLTVGLRRLSLAALALACSTGQAGCDSRSTSDRWVLASVVTNVDLGTRSVYVQTIDTLTGTFTNTHAREIPNNATLLPSGRHVFVGLAEEPTWIRYEIDDGGAFVETGRLSLVDEGFSRIDLGNVVVDEHTAVTVSSTHYAAVVWDPTDLVVRGRIDLPHLKVDGYRLENWTTTAHDGRVYVPGRWIDGEAEQVRAGVSLTILDPVALSVVGVAEDTRCSSGGRVVIGPDGHAYVMGDGHNFSLQLYASGRGEPPPRNCILRLRHGETTFDPTYVREVRELTGSVEAVSELTAPSNGGPFAFAWMFHPDAVPAGATATSGDFWKNPAFRLWRLTLGDDASAVPVDGLLPSAMGLEGAPSTIGSEGTPSTIGFEGGLYDGKSYVAEVQESARSVVYEVDPTTNLATRLFSMEGAFYGLHRVR